MNLQEELTDLAGEADRAVHHKTCGGVFLGTG